MSLFCEFHFLNGLFSAIFKDFLAARLTRGIIDAPDDDINKDVQKHLIFLLSFLMEDFWQAVSQESLETTFCESYVVIYWHLNT